MIRRLENSMVRYLKVHVGVAEREKPLMHETAIAVSIPPYTYYSFFHRNFMSGTLRICIGLRIVVINVVEGQGL